MHITRLLHFIDPYKSTKGWKSDRRSLSKVTTTRDNGITDGAARSVNDPIEHTASVTVSSAIPFKGYLFGSPSTRYPLIQRKDTNNGCSIYSCEGKVMEEEEEEAEENDHDSNQVVVNEPNNYYSEANEQQYNSNLYHVRMNMETTHNWS